MAYLCGRYYVPLGINILQLNLQQYKKTLSSITSDLRENALFKAHTLQQTIPLNIDILALFSEIFDLDRGVPAEPDLALSKEMEKIFHSTYKEISLVKKRLMGTLESLLLAASNNLVKTITKRFSYQILNHFSLLCDIPVPILRFWLSYKRIFLISALKKSLAYSIPFRIPTIY